MDPASVPDVVVHDAVRDVIARYTWAGDRGDSAGVAALFRVDGVLDVGAHGGRWEGRDRIRAELERVAAEVAAAGGSPGPVQHHVASVAVQRLGPTEASAVAYFSVFTAIGLDHWGRYRDRLSLDADGAWRFDERRVRVDGASPGSLMVPPAS